MLNISLIGAGFIGRVHAQCIAAHPAARLAAVHDLDGSAAAALAERHGARVAGSLGEIVASRRETRDCRGSEASCLRQSPSSPCTPCSMLS